MVKKYFNDKQRCKQLITLFSVNKGEAKEYSKKKQTSSNYRGRSGKLSVRL